MVTKLRQGKTVLYVCDACGFAYKQKKWAEKCQAWCEQHHSCNLDIAEHAVPLDSEATS